MQCPVCNDVALSISSREGVEIDYCPDCRGVWLDRGELDKILDRVAAATPPAAAGPDRGRAAGGDTRAGRGADDWDRDRGDGRGGDRDRKRRRRRSLLDELFDFD